MPVARALSLRQLIHAELFSSSSCTRRVRRRSSRSRQADARDRRDRESHARSRARVRGPGNPERLARVLVPQVVMAVVVVVWWWLMAMVVVGDGRVPG